MMFSFADHVALLRQFLNRRHEIAENIESRLLNVRGKDASRSRHRGDVEQTFNSCFFNSPGLPSDLVRLKGHLAATHLADGFEPVLLEKHSHELDPLELIARAYHYWENHRWPGRSGRATYAQSLYSVFLLRQLENLSLRIWDEGNDRAGDRLQDIQLLLDRLNDASSSNVFIRDARWLIQTAQGPLTRHLLPYFRIAEQISGSFTDAERLEIHNAGVKLAGGHLRSQLRYRVLEMHRPIEGFLPEGIVPAQAHCLTSDLTRALSSGATAFPKNQIVSDRNEGRFLASAESDGKWFGISKIILTACTSQGKDALVAGVPPPVVDVLRLSCRGLVMLPGRTTERPAHESSC